MSDEAAGEAVGEASRFWAVVRLVWAAALVVTICIGLVENREWVFGSIGNFAGLVLLEGRQIRDGRSPFFNHWLRQR